MRELMGLRKPASAADAAAAAAADPPSLEARMRACNAKLDRLLEADDAEGGGAGDAGADEEVGDCMTTLDQSRARVLEYRTYW